MPVAKLSPKAFAESHRKLVEGVVAPAAERLKVKTLNTKLESDLFSRRDAADVAVVLDNIKEIGDASSRALPLKELYDTSESMALAAAKAAAKASGGVLDKSSARFLPFEYQADFEKVTGVKIDDKPGSAVKGVKIKLDGKDAHVEINFKEALAGATAKKVVLGLTQRVAIIAERVEPATNPNLPPYWVYISPRPGKNPSGTELVRDTGISGFNSPDDGSLIRAGESKIDLAEMNHNDRVTGHLTFKVDQMNDLGSNVKGPTEKTRAVRTAWTKRFNAADNVINLKGLPKLTRAEFEALPGAKTLLSGIRADFGSISHLIKDQRIEFARDPASKSAVAYVYADGEGESWLHVLDEKARKWVGTLSIGDDGTKSWAER